MSARISTVAILLAAGAGSRFAGSRFAGSKHKLTAKISGRTVCAWSLQHLIDADFEQIVVITGAVDLTKSFQTTPEFDLSSVKFVHNSLWQSGLASSLQCGLTVAKNLGAQAVVVGLADQPAIPTSAWIRVASCPSPIAVATYNGVRGNPVRVHAELWAMLPETGDEGARTLFKSHRDLIEEVPCTGSALDVDTTQDLEELRLILTKPIK